MSRNCNPYLVILSYSAVFIALCHPNYFAQILSSHLAAMPIESEQPNLIPSWWPALVQGSACLPGHNGSQISWECITSYFIREIVIRDLNVKHVFSGSSQLLKLWPYEQCVFDFFSPQRCSGNQSMLENNKTESYEGGGSPTRGLAFRDK